ncbi:MAG: CHAT domain-containing tetratricopeptide repeat protein, partial [Bacteroidota bacterium]
SDLGILYVNWGRTGPAREAFENGLNLPNISALIRTTINLNYSDILTNEGEYEKAGDYIDDAEQLMIAQRQNEGATPRTTRIMAGIHQKRANLAIAQGLHNEALLHFQDELELLQAYYGNTKRRELGKNYINRAEPQIELEHYPEAIISYQKALEMVLYKYDAVKEEGLPAADQFYAENTIFEALSGMAETYTRWAAADANPELLENALDCYERSHEAEQVLRRNYLYDTSKLINLEESRERSEKAIQVAHRLFEQTGKKEYLYQAFVFAERNRGTLLREAFRVTQATEIAGISTEEQAQEQELKNLVSEAEEWAFRLRSQETTDSTLQAAEEALLNARDSLNTWIKSLEERHPKYYQLKYADQVPSLAELQEMLPSGELLLEYFLGREHLYIFKIDQSGLNLYELPLPPRLTERIQRWRRSIEQYQQVGQDRTALLAQYREEAYLLYQDLLAPVLSPMMVVDRLTIISSGILDLVPFEALLTRAVTSSTQLSQYPYLLQDFNISYSYSAALQWRLSKLARSSAKKVGFAPSFSQQSGWPQLSCSASLLQNTIGQSGGTILSGGEASISQFQLLAPQFGLLHLATHAQANPEEGDFSYIVFSDGQNGLDSLFAKDLYLYDLEAELVILSACETALGTLYNSEGVISLARAFHYAGARSVLTTLWRINEGANCHLLEQFYAALDTGMDKKEALRSAKLAYLET